MPQSDGVNTIKRIEFAYGGKSYKFKLNPEEYEQDEPNRANVTQTKAGAWIDEFGAGVPIISMRGTTGLSDGKKNTAGFQKFKELRDLIRNVYNRVQPGQSIPASKEMHFYNYTDGEYWVVTPITFKLTRTVARPLLYSYDITLICQRKLSQPSNAQKASGNSITNARSVK
ncbi:hypothetical protein EalM132_00081 [Exiguobacterium phage vB_EalM-132]|nr:hypothetical protein EalM132_00081 [Exiguobacterium phage vB_EalM-132]